MNYSNVFINAIDYKLPPIVISTAELEERIAPTLEKLHIPEGQIEDMTGIYERRWWDPNFEISKGAAEAGKKAMKKASIAPEDIEMLVYAGVCREQFEPATACKVASILGLKGDTLIYDLSNACLGVLNGILEVANRIQLGQIKAGMVVSAESSREITEITIDDINRKGSIDFFLKALAVITGGSGAVAVVLTDNSLAGLGAKLIGGAYKAAPQFYQLCRWGMELVTENMQKMTLLTDSAKVLKYGVELAIETWKKFVKTTGWNSEKIDKTICHQVGSAHSNSILKALNIPESKDFVTYPYLGNIGTVSLPITYAIAEEKGIIHKGMKTALMGIGSGLNCMMLGVEC